jgi:hypothetical protein
MAIASFDVERDSNWLVMKAADVKLLQRIAGIDKARPDFEFPCWT